MSTNQESSKEELTYKFAVRDLIEAQLVNITGSETVNARNILINEYEHFGLGEEIQNEKEIPDCLWWELAHIYACDINIKRDAYPEDFKLLKKSFLDIFKEQLNELNAAERRTMTDQEQEKDKGEDDDISRKVYPNLINMFSMQKNLFKNLNGDQRETSIRIMQFFIDKDQDKK